MLQRPLDTMLSVRGLELGDPIDILLPLLFFRHPMSKLSISIFLIKQRLINKHVNVFVISIIMKENSVTMICTCDNAIAII